ncbi:EF-hand domain-containing protein [Sphingomonas sp. RS6]
MRKQMLTATAIAMITIPATQASAQTTSGFHNRAEWFEAADRNNDEKLSRQEFSQFRMNTIGRSQLSSYRADQRSNWGTTISRSFSTLDLDNNGMITPTEFANAPTLMQQKTMQTQATQAQAMQANTAQQGNGWASAATRGNTYASANDRGVRWYNPDYVTATYYLTVTPVDTDVFEGQKVVNLKGDTVGQIDRIVRTEDNNRYYAMIDLRGTDFTTLGGVPRTEVGVPLDDVLLFRDGKSLYLSTRGEEYLRDTDAKEVRNPEVVDKLYL